MIFGTGGSIFDIGHVFGGGNGDGGNGNGGGDPVTYDTDAQAYFDALTVQPSAGWKAAVNTFVEGLKTDDIWSEMALISVMASEEKQHALVNLVDPTDTATDTTSGGDTPVIHTANVGLQRHSTSGLILWNNTPANYGITSGDGIIAAHIRTNNTQGIVCGDNHASNFRTQLWLNPTIIRGRMQSAQTRSYSITLAEGIYCYMRDGSRTRAYAGTSSAGNVLEGTLPPLSNFVSMLGGGISLSDHQLALVVVGKNVSALDYLNKLHGRMQTLVSDIDAL